MAFDKTNRKNFNFNKVMKFLKQLKNFCLNFQLVQKPKDTEASDRSRESFERAPFISAAFTHLGFYILMFLGFINQLLFTPKVAREQRREVLKSSKIKQK